jgi:hypothetical protein
MGPAAKWAAFRRLFCDYERCGEVSTRLCRSLHKVEMVVAEPATTTEKSDKNRAPAMLTRSAEHHRAASPCGHGRCMWESGEIAPDEPRVVVEKKET